MADPSFGALAAIHSYSLASTSCAVATHRRPQHIQVHERRQDSRLFRPPREKVKSVSTGCICGVVVRCMRVWRTWERYWGRQEKRRFRSISATLVIWTEVFTSAWRSQVCGGKWLSRVTVNSKHGNAPCKGLRSICAHFDCLPVVSFGGYALRKV